MPRATLHVHMDELLTLPPSSGVCCLSYSSSSPHAAFASIVAYQKAGAIGPGRLFSPGQTYGSLLWFFLVGPVVVVITYLLGCRWKAVNYLSWPVAFGAMSLVPPATGVSFSSWWVINALFNGLIRRRKPAWWSKYSISPHIIALLRWLDLTYISRLCFIRCT